MTWLSARTPVWGVVFLLVLAVVPAVGAQTEGGIDLDAMVEVYNENVDEAPGIARGELAGKTIELRVGSGSTMATTSSGEVYHFTTDDDGRVEDAGEGDADSPNVRVRTSEATLDRILESDDPAAEFDAAYEDGDVTIGGVTLTDTIKIELVKFGVWLGKLFGFI